MQTPNTVHFTRQPDGAYRFESPATGRTYEARKAEDGGWMLAEVTWYPVADGRYHEIRTDLPYRYFTRAEARDRRINAERDEAAR